MKDRILVVSSANVDFVQRVCRVPDAGETVTEVGNGYSYVPGGKGANAALTFARMGADTVLCAKVGNDSNGTRLKQLYSNEGIDVRFLSADRTVPTGLASILVEDDGSNRIVVYPGANTKLSPADVEAGFTCYPDALFLQFEIPDKAIAAAARFAAEKEIPVFIDAAPARSNFPLDILKRVEIFSPNESETEILTGIKPVDGESCLRAAIRLSTSLDVNYIIIKLGKRGCYLYDGKYYRMVSSYDVEAVDTTAAGDVYTASLTYDYMQTKDIVHAINFATAAAAISVTRHGASTSIPTKAEVLKFIDEKGVIIR